MIGQESLRNTIDSLCSNKCFPRFSIITGQRGSGKKTLAKYIANQLNAYAVYPGNGVDDVRTSIENAYHCTFSAVYIFADSDKMSTQAKNALLKVTEEPPRSAYFILTVEDINNTLSTLKSRGTVFEMEPYSWEDLQMFTNDENIVRIASNPGQVDQMKSMEFDKFLDFCYKVIDNIGNVSGVNALKIGQSFSFKEDQEGYDPILFMDCMIYICSSRALSRRADYSTIMKYAKILSACMKCKNDLKIVGLKKDSTFDMWLLEVRELCQE